MGMFERQVREWAGTAARLKKMGPLKMLAFNVVGDTLVFKGKVASVESSEEGQISTLDLWCETERGQTTTCVIELLT